MVALGGIATDLLADRSFRPLPLSRAAVREQVRSLRAAPLLFGYRGSKPVDVKALEDLILRVGQLASEIPQLAELDLNPVLAMPDGATAVDTKVRLLPHHHTDPYLRRLSPGTLDLPVSGHRSLPSPAAPGQTQKRATEEE